MALQIILIVFQIIQASGSSTNVRQTPSEIFVETGQPSEVQCSHSIQDYNRILWYKQLQGSTSLLLLGYMNVDDGYPEKGVDVEIKGGVLKNQICKLSINSNIESAKYFCAASRDNTYEAFFGEGTKLTVLEKDHKKTPPTVKLFPPSSKERPRIKGDTRFKTLVCLAQDFYPDHVEVFWGVNGEAIRERVSTDTAAQRKGKTYTISSRLVVPAEDWTNPANCFNCTVSFYDGTSTNNFTDGVCGDAQKDGGRSREKYLRTTQNAKLSYTVFIVKSGVYGLFVAFLVWKNQRADRKQT